MSSEAAAASGPAASVIALDEGNDLLSVLALAHAQHGLRHSDFGRYRRYCARRLRRLHKALGLTHATPKGHFVPRQLAAADVTDARHLLLPLFAAERTWALSQELSNAARDAGGGGPAHRQRGHAVKRLAKAAAWGRALAALAASRADARTALAAASYSSWLSGLLLQERGADWGGALRAFDRAAAGFEALAKGGGGEAAAAAAARQRLTDLGPSQRLCRHKGGLAAAAAGTAPPFAPFPPAADSPPPADAASSDAVLLAGCAVPLPSGAARAAVAAARAAEARARASPAPAAAQVHHDARLAALADAAAALRSEAVVSSSAAALARAPSAADSAAAAAAAEAFRLAEAAVGCERGRAALQRDASLIADLEARIAAAEAAAAAASAKAASLAAAAAAFGPAPGGVKASQGRAGRRASAAASSAASAAASASSAVPPASSLVRLHDAMLATLSGLAELAASCASRAHQQTASHPSRPAASSPAASAGPSRDALDGWCARIQAEERLVRCARAAALGVWQRAHRRDFAAAAALADRAGEHAAAAGAAAAEAARLWPEGGGGDDDAMEGVDNGGVSIGGAPLHELTAASLAAAAAAAAGGARRDRLAAALEAHDAASAAAAAAAAAAARRLAGVALTPHANGSSPGLELGSGPEAADASSSVDPSSFLLDSLGLFEPAARFPMAPPGSTPSPAPPPVLFQFPPPLESIAVPPLVVDAAFARLRPPSVAHRAGAAAAAAAAARAGGVGGGGSRLGRLGSLLFRGAGKQ